MKQKKKLLIPALTIVMAVSCLCFAACGKDDVDDNYPVAGVWHAVATWREDNTFTLGGQNYRIIDDYQVDFYFDFRPDGSVMKKSIIRVNNSIMHTDNEEWNILNVTWSVKGNVITLSSGIKFVIVDDEFDDTFPAKNILLRYKKEETPEDDTAKQAMKMKNTQYEFAAL